MSDNKSKPNKNKRQKIKHNQYSQSNKIYNYLVNTTNPEAKNDEESTYGATHTLKSKDTIRLWFTNPCGLGVDPFSFKSDDSLHFLRHKSKCDIFGLAETNLHWKMLHNTATLYSRLRQKWKYFKSVTSHNMHAKLGKTQRGGTCMATVGQAAYRHYSHGEDPSGLGRWTWMEFRGRDEHATRVYTAYRPGGKPSSDSERTTVYHQHKRYLRKNNINMEPRDYFDNDILAEIKDQVQEKNVVLMIDVNQNVITGHFTKAMEEIGMLNAVDKLNPEPLPATHHRGSNPISAIYATQALEVTRAGILPKGLGVHGDHRNMFLDITAGSFLGTYMYLVISPPMKRLQLHDSRIVRRFKKHTLEHLKANGMLEMAESLFKSVTYPPTSKMIEDMERFDEQLGRAITVGKKKSRKLCTGNIPYSSVFANLRDTRRIWLLVRKRKLGQKVSCRTIRRLAKKLLIQNPLSLPIQEVNQLLRTAEQQYKALTRQQAWEGRMKFNEELAAANAAASNGDKVKILTQIIKLEQQREQTIVTRKYFPKKGASTQQVNRVQYEDGDIWKEAYRPRDVLKACQNDTKRKYSETSSTPLMREPLHSLFGNFSETPFAREFQKGHRQPPIPLPEFTAEMLEYTKHDDSIPSVPITITGEEIKQTWKLVKEHKASAPSGRYNGVYKAMTQDTHLLRILEVSMNLPLLTGYSYQRWNTMIDIMAFKKPDNIKVSNIRSIIISEADWNSIGKLIIAKKMMKNAETHCLLPREHIGGRKSRKATDGALTKRLIIDNSRLLQKPLAIISTDATNCYDRMLHKFIAMICIKWGIAPQVIQTLLYPLQKAKHHTRTAYGDSSTFFQGRNLQGAGQGNTGAAPYWTAVSTVMIDLIKKRGLFATMQSPMGDEEIMLALLAFVDDTELFITDDDDNIDQLIQKAQLAIDTWKELLHVTGGIMRSNKCAWTLVNFDKNKYSPRSMDKDPGSLYLQDEDGKVRMVERYDKDSPREYLGICQTVNGKDDEQLQAMEKAVTKWNKLIQASKLPPVMNLQALMSKIHKTLQYPLPTLAASQKDLQKLSNKLYWTSLPKCGIVRTFPIQFRHLPYKYQGLNLPDLYIEQESSKLQELISFSYKDSVVWDQLCISLEILQHHLGLSDIVYNFPYEKFYSLCEHTWITSQWKFISSQSKIKIKGWTKQRKKQRVHDSFLMEDFAQHPDISCDELKILNTCRKFLQVWTVSDITNGSGTRITSKAFTGRFDSSRPSKDKWASIRRPVETHWEIWRRWIQILYCEQSSEGLLKTTLGHWTDTSSQKWMWYIDPITRNLYKALPGHFCCYKVNQNARSSYRLGSISYKLDSIVDPSTINLKDMCRATISNENTVRYLEVKCDGWSRVEFPIPPQPRFPLSPSILNVIQIQQWMYQQGNLHQYDISTIQTIISKPLRLVSDGSYKESLGAACVILEPYDSSSQLIIACPVPSNADAATHHNDPYRCELVGIYVGMCFIQQFEQYFHTRMTVTISCDSDSALLVPASYQYSNASNPHFDVVRALLHKRDMIKSNIMYEPVQGHADLTKPAHELTRVEILNKSCDLIAKAYRETMDSSSPIIFGNEGLSLWIGETKIYNKFISSVKNMYYDSKANSVLSSKYEWKNNEFTQIHWDATSKAASLLSTSTLIRISKVVTKTLPIGRVMENRKSWREAYCPRCENTIETCSHICKCPHQQSRTIMGKSIQKLSNWLQSVNTEQNLHDELILFISLWTSDSTLPLTSTILPIKLQLELGWYHLMEGRIHIAFAEYMDHHYKIINSRMKGLTWSSIFIQKLWSYIFNDQWECRNKIVHGIDKSRQSTREHQNLNYDIRQWYSSETSEDLLYADRHLLEPPLTETLRKTSAVKKAWLEDMKLAVETRNASRIREEVYSVNIMQRFLTTRPVHNLRSRTRRRHQSSRRLISMHRRKKIRIAHEKTRNLARRIPSAASRLKRPRKRFLEIHEGRKKKGGKRKQN